eukprot:2033976-Pyramimonas_sp.AAC.1
MDHGIRFVWPAGQRPYFLLSNGQRVDLIVEGKIPCLTLSGRGALGQWMCAAAAGKPVIPGRWRCATSGAETFLGDVESAGGPPPQSVQSR